MYFSFFIKFYNVLALSLNYPIAEYMELHMFLLYTFHTNASGLK